MHFAVPMFRRVPSRPTCVTDCYFCITKVVGCSEKDRSKIVYSNISSALRPDIYDAEKSVPNPPVVSGIKSNFVFYKLNMDLKISRLIVTNIR